MSRWIIFLAAVILFSACVSPPAECAGGIQGTASIGPTCPVVRPDLDCRDRPYAGDFSVTGQGGVKYSFSSADDGSYFIPLPPGEYVIKLADSAAYPRMMPLTVAVDCGIIEQNLSLDSGIRTPMS